MAANASGQYIFWTDEQAGCVLRADSDGPNIMTIFQDEETRHLAGLTFDSERSVVTWMADNTLYQSDVSG